MLVATAAEAAGLVVLHYDHDFDLISDITGRRTERSSEPERFLDIPASHGWRSVAWQTRSSGP
jgi:hypothetical protein